MFARKKNTKGLSEAEIIRLAKSESFYFGELYERYFDQIFRFVYKRLGGKELDAGDITQTTFLKAMANINKYEDRGLPFSSWLFRIAQNEVSMFFRMNKTACYVDLAPNRLTEIVQEANIDGYMSQDDQEKLIHLLNELDSEHLDLIELRFFIGMSFKEIAEIYNITEANTKMKTYRILEKLNTKWKLRK